MNAQEDDVVEISRKLIKMTDGSKPMDDALELITALENMRVNIDLLTKTRIGAVLDEFRKKIKDEKLAKRCKMLAKRWKALLDERQSQRSKSPDERHGTSKRAKGAEADKEKPSFVPSGALAKDASTYKSSRADDERRERDRGRGRREREEHRHHHHHREHEHQQHRHHRRHKYGRADSEGEPPAGGWDKPKWDNEDDDDTVKREEQGDEAERRQWQNGDGANAAKEGEEAEKEKPSFVPSGKLAKDTNTYKGVLIKYNEPPEAKLPKLRWRMYPFKGEENLPVIYVHRQSAYLIGRDRKIADFPIDHPSCSKQHAALQYRSLPYERADGSTGRRTRPYIIDLGSGNGTFLNGERIEAQRYYELREKDVLRFGFSSREYVMLHEHSAGASDDAAAAEDTSADEDDDAGGGGEPIDRTGGEERIAAAEEDNLF